MMDADKDGILGKADLIKIYDIVGKLVTDKEVSISSFNSIKVGIKTELKQSVHIAYLIKEKALIQNVMGIVDLRGFLIFPVRIKKSIVSSR